MAGCPKPDPGEVADALGLHDREVLDWATGTDRAYRYGVYVAAPVPGWTLAHGRLHMPTGFDATEPPFPDWLSRLSRHLGEVQFFANERVPDYHPWARALDGELLRAYCFIGERGEVPLFVGDPTAHEIELGIGIRGKEPGWEHWSDGKWTAWYETTPSESDVMAMARSLEHRPERDRRRHRGCNRHLRATAIGSNTSRNDNPR